MAKGIHLLERDGMFYYRRRVPKEIQTQLEKKVIQYSLKTSLFTEAKRRRNEADVEWDQKFETGRLDLTVNKAVPSTIGLNEAIQRVESHFKSLSKKLAEDFAANPPNSDEIFKERVVETGTMISLYDLPVSEETEFYLYQSYQKLFGDSYDIFVGGKVVADRIFDLIRKGSLALYKEDQLRLKSIESPSEIGKVFAFSKQIPKQPNGILIEELADQFLINYNSEAKAKGLEKKTIDKTNSHIRLCAELVGAHTLVIDLSFDECLKFRGRLSKIPSNKGTAYKGLSADAAIKQAVKDNHPVMSLTTQHDYLRSFAKMIEFARLKGVLSVNPAKGLSPVGKKTPLSKSRDPFDKGELKAIFSTGIYDVDSAYDPKGKLSKEARFYIPLMAVFMGLRVNEASQLTIEDVRISKEGIPYLDINEDGPNKKLKNDNAVRLTPLHPVLIDLGFQEFVEDQNHKGKEKVFPEIIADSYGSQSRLASRWFSDSHLPCCIQKKKGQGLHCLRHNFKDAMRIIEAPWGVQNAVGGWSEGKGVSANYGNKAHLSRLSSYDKWVKQIGYAEIDISKLKLISG